MASYKLNVIPGDAPVVVHVNQLDVGYTIAFEIYDGATVFSLSEYTARLDIFKADRNVFSGGTITISGNTATVLLEEQMTAMWGPCIAELVFIAGGIRRATANFILDVEKSPLEDGSESESVINYIEDAREATEAATEAAEEATEAAEDAAQAAADAAEAATNTVSNIEAMPTTLQALAASLASTGDPTKLLGFNSSNGAESFDVGFVTPQMYGAVGNGTTNDTTAFQDALASGKKVVIPPGSYKLNSILWTDDSVVISDAGTYTNKPLIISKNLRDDAPIERFITQINPSNDNALDYRIQAGCYDSTRDRIILSFCTDYESTSDNTDLVLTAYDTDWTPISGMSVTITGGGHGNALCYNPNTDKIYSVCGNGDHQIAVINASDLSFDSWLDPVSESRPWQMAYDVDNDIYYIQYTTNSVPKYRAYDASFTALDETFPIGASDVVDIGKLHYGSDGLNTQAPIVIDGQLLQVMCGSKATTTVYASNGAHLVQYNYHDGTPKKIYRVTTLYQNSDEPQCLVNVDGRIYMVTDIGSRSGQMYLSISQLVFDGRVSGQSDSPYKDAKLFAASDAEKNLDNILSIGCYTAPSPAVVATLSNAPCDQPFNLYVIPSVMNRDSRIQIAVSYRGEIYVRTYYASTPAWYGWRQIAETPRSGTSRTGSWTGAGYITSNGTEIRFTIPLATRTIVSANPAVTIGSLNLKVRQGGVYLLEDVDVANADGYTVTASANVFGINIVVVADSALSGATNNDAVGIQATVSMSFE